MKMQVTLSPETASVFEEAARKFGLTTRQGTGIERPNVSGFLGLLAGAIEDGTIDLTGWTVQPGRLTLVRK